VTASVDTNVLLRLLLSDLPEQHAAAVSLLSDPAVAVRIADAALIEAAFALEKYYGLPRADIDELLRGVLDLPTVEGSHEVFRAALRHWSAHHKLSLTDCHLAETAIADGALPLWTFDKKLARQHGAARQLASREV
jgi:predicted nucleic acid-binding protein